MTVSSFTRQIIEAIRDIPYGKVATYGGIAAMAGNRRAARQVARTLHTFGAKEKLPWHRVINREGKISLPEHNGYNRQKTLLEAEGVEFDCNGRIDLERFLWRQ